jgi:SAM-dependent methyltransferase
VLATRDLVRDERPDDVGVSVAYPLPGTKFHAAVRGQLGARTNWEDTGDLAMLFQGTYTTAFYRRLRDALHAEALAANPTRWFALGEERQRTARSRPPRSSMRSASAVQQQAPLSPAIQAFDAVAARFDTRFGAWRSVAAQRREVRTLLASAFPRGARVLEIGGGTGEDARWLSARGREVLLTDGAPSMVHIAREKLRSQRGPEPRVVSAERLGDLAEERDAAGLARFDGAFSNFAALNCVDTLDTFAAGLARLLRPGAPALLVLFGTLCPGEVVVQIARGDRGRPAAPGARTRGRAPRRARFHRALSHHVRAAACAVALVPVAPPRRHRRVRAAQRRGAMDLRAPGAGKNVGGDGPRGLACARAAGRSRAVLVRADVDACWTRVDNRRPVRAPMRRLVVGGGWGVHDFGILLPPGRVRLHPLPATPRPVPLCGRGADDESRHRSHQRFRREYADHRASEGRAALDARTLPYVTSGPLARQWSVRARSWEAFERRVLRPALRRARDRAAGPLRVLDLGAGNGWLAHRAAIAGAEAVALDVRGDRVDGLGASPPGSAWSASSRRSRRSR